MLKRPWTKVTLPYQFIWSSYKIWDKARNHSCHIIPILQLFQLVPLHLPWAQWRIRQLISSSSSNQAKSRYLSQLLNLKFKLVCSLRSTSSQCFNSHKSQNKWNRLSTSLVINPSYRWLWTMTVTGTISQTTSHNSNQLWSPSIRRTCQWDTITTLILRIHPRFQHPPWICTRGTPIWYLWTTGLLTSNRRSNSP